MTKLYFSTLLLFTLLTAWSCQGDGTNSGKAVQGITPSQASSVADIIRNPVTQDASQMDTSKMAKLSFTEDVFRFGTVDEGAVISHEFQFTNTGTVPLIISDVRSTCGCTVADWPKDPIAPGDSGKIPVRFDTKNKEGFQDKPITITANTYPAQTVLHLKGTVE